MSGRATTPPIVALTPDYVDQVWRLLLTAHVSRPLIGALERDLVRDTLERAARLTTPPPPSRNEHPPHPR